MDLLDKVLLEWSARTEKGYPDLNNEQDLAIFESMFGFKLNEQDEEKNTVRNIEDILQTVRQAGIKDSYTLNSIEKIYNNLPEIKKLSFNKYFRTLPLTQEGLEKISEVYGDFFDAKASKGMGRGEAMIILGAKNASSGGTADKDIIVDGKIFEVKELSGREFSPGKDGDINGTEYDSNYRILKKCLTPSVLEVVEEYLTEEEFVLIQDIVNYTQKNTTRNQKGSYVRSIKKIASRLKEVLPRIEKEDIHYISVNGSKEIVISADDLAKLTPGNEVTLKLGDELKQSTKDINLLKKHPWITEPGSNVNQLEDILSNFFRKLDGLIIYNSKSNLLEPVLMDKSTARESFSTSRVTQGMVLAKLKK